MTASTARPLLATHGLGTKRHAKTATPPPQRGMMEPEGRMADVKRVAEYIQRFAELIGVPIDPLDKDGFTQVARGSATVGINVVEQKGFILFLAPIMDVPSATAKISIAGCSS